ncbi:MAG: FAD/NAD(P)-binding oxidoreductase [Sulfurimonadaceae bacterium]|jgi:sulfide:quinone oxidoreductase|nr:FAD/NAD(P)-binding oxidoreductase [Arcobacteraceae bacterium]
MMNKDLNDSLELLDNELKKQGLSRRDALKVAGLGSAAFLLGGSEVEAATVANASDVKAKIVIVGGGLAGVATAARLTNSLSNPDITIIEPNPKSVSYQPGNTLIASGVYTKDDIMYNTNEYLPKGVKLIADYAVEFDPDNNKLTTKSGEEVSYDFLVIAAGLKLDFGRIKGLESIGEAYTLGDSSKLLETFANSGVSSIYTVDGAVATWNNMQKFVADAKAGKKVKGVFTDPNTAIKCGGAPKKIMYLTNARLNEAGARANAELTFYPNGGKMFGVPEYHEAILQQFKDRDFKWNYAHNLTGVDLENKIATFDHHWKEKGEYDQDLEEYTMVTKHEDVQVEFDFLHITPPQKAPDEIGNSPLGSSKGWVPVDKETLQHVKYPNVFSIGDIAAVPMGKTGGSVRKQYKALVDNLIAAMEGKPLTSKYDGYTVCPLITDIGKVMLAEFNWTAKPTPSFPLDPTQERYIWWLLKVYMLKPMTMHGMLSGKA